MCHPAVAIAATVFSAYQQYTGAQAQAKAAVATANNNRAIAEYNAKLSEVNASREMEAARDAKQRGAGDAATMRQNALKANARARAVSASKGLLADTGSNLDILKQNAQMGELNALTIQNNAEREAYGHLMKKQDYESEAASLRFSGDVGVANARYNAGVTKRAGLMNAGTTLVTGAADTAYKYPKFFGLEAK